MNGKRYMRPKQTKNASINLADFFDDGGELLVPTTQPGHFFVSVSKKSFHRLP